MTSPDRERVSVSRADLEALFGGFDNGTWVRADLEAYPLKWYTADKAIAARDRLHRSLHGDVQQEVVDEVAAPAQEAHPPAPSTNRAPAPEGLPANHESPEWRAYRLGRSDELARCQAVARGCLDYGGGYRNDEQRSIFHHGIETVGRALAAPSTDLQVRVLESIGRQPIEGFDGRPLALAAPSALEAFEGAADRLASEAVDVAMGREGGE